MYIVHNNITILLHVYFSAAYIKLILFCSTLFVVNSIKMLHMYIGDQYAIFEIDTQNTVILFQFEKMCVCCACFVLMCPLFTPMFAYFQSAEVRWCCLYIFV
jgi:hypothetical protein